MKRSTLNGVLIVMLAVIMIGAAIGLSGCSLLGSVAGGTTTKKATVTNQTYSVSLHNIEGYSVYDFIDKNTNIIKKPSVIPEKEGYDFVGWCSDEECTKELAYGTVISSNLDIYPHWKVKTYTVTLVDTVAGTSDAIEVEYGEKAVLPTYRAAGYEFKGWYVNESASVSYDTTKKVMSDMTLYTGWTMLNYNINYYVDGGKLATGAATVYNMFGETTLPSCSKVGYVFTGWYDNADRLGTIYTVIPKGQQGEKNFYAGYLCVLAEVDPKVRSVKLVDDEISFSVKYVQTSIDLTDYLSFSQGASYTLEKDGLAVSSINLTENNGEDSIIHEYDLTVTSESGTTVKEYALTITQFSARYLTVNYYSNGALYYTDAERQAGDQAETIEDPVPEEGYLFNCWLLGSLSGEEYDFDSVLSEDISLYAQFVTIPYDIVYHVGYGTNGLNPAKYTVEDAVIFQTAASTSEEYTFEGWYDSDDYSNKVTGIALGSTGGKEFYARYTMRNQVIVDFDGQTTIAKEDLTDYFIYAFYYRLTTLEVEVTGGEDGEEIESYVRTANEAAGFVDGSAGRLLHWSNVPADSSGVWDLTDTHKITVEYADMPTLSSQKSEFAQVESADMSFSSAGRAEDFDDFAINHIKEGIMVEDSEQLVFAVEHGYRPEPKAGSVAEEIYEKAKIVLRTYVDDTMNDYEKALAIYEYIIKNISYDHDIYDKVISNEILDEEASQYFCFYLDGVFNAHVAVCDGYSKAFMLLCRMEGIRTVQIEGSAVVGGTGHAWNKIRLSVDGEERQWYVVDCTSGDTLTRFSANPKDAKEVMTHAYFLFTDEQMATKYSESGEYDSYECTANGDYYSHVTFERNEKEYIRSISDDEQMAAFLSYLIASTPNDKQISLDIHICLEDNTYDPFLYDENHVTNGIKNSILQSVGVILNSYNITWVTTTGFNAFTFLSTKK